MCEVTQPTPADRICDPAAGTGGFLCNAYQYVLDRFERDLDRDEKRTPTFSEDNPEGRWRCYAYDELLKCDKLSLDLFWIKDKSLTDTDSLPSPDVLATEIADDLEAALEQFTKIAARLGRGSEPQR